MGERTQELSKRALLELTYDTVLQLRSMMSAASEYMTTALSDLDSQMQGLQSRLAADSQALQDAIARADLGQKDSQALQDAAARVQATADLVSGLAQPSAVADEQQPDVVAEPVPAEGDAGGQTGGDTGTDAGTDTGFDSGSGNTGTEGENEAPAQFV